MHGKRIDNWMRLKSTQSLISKTVGDGVKALQGRNGETIATEDIAQEFEKWCLKAKATAPCYVYLVRAVGTTSFKIGVSSDSRKRVRDMQIGSPVKLILSRNDASVNALEVERLIHKRLNEHRTHGEWFSCPIEKALTVFEECFF